MFFLRKLHHTVIMKIKNNVVLWFNKYQGERDPCKHILAVKKLVKV